MAAAAAVVADKESRRRRGATDSRQAFRSKNQVEGWHLECRRRKEEQGIDSPFDWGLRDLHQAPRPGRRNYTSDCPPWCLITRGKEEEGKEPKFTTINTESSPGVNWNCMRDSQADKSPTRGELAGKR